MKAVLPRPADATLSVAKAARVLGVHPNTVRSWSDAGRLRYYRINPRGDRRYRLPDLQRFLVLTRVDGSSEPASSPEGRDARQVPRLRPQQGRMARGDSRLLADLADLTVAAVAPGANLQELLDWAVRLILDAGAYRLVLIQQRSGAGLETRSTATSTPSRSMGRERTRSIMTAQGGQGTVPAARHRLRAEIPGEHGPWGVLLVEDSDRRHATRAGNVMGHADLEAAARVIGSIVRAMANADLTERLREQSTALERQLQSQRELLGITESILAILDPSTLLEQIADRLAFLVGCDTVTIEVLDPASGLLVPVTARGVRAHQRMEPWHPGETGLAGWVAENNTPVLLSGAGGDPRISRVRDQGAIEGSSIAVPLRGQGGSTGVLTVERLGPRDPYTTDEFELVQLFAAQASIALQNAEIHSAVEIRARTDALTGLLNHGTFVERLSRAVDQGDAFSLLMLDLDDFRRVTDALGHQAGDQLLGDIARALVGAIRDGDHAFRYGGDEFTILLAGSEGPAAAMAAERVRTALLDVARPTTPWHAAGIEVSASIGIASFPGDGPDATSILLAADRACFAARRSGRGRIASAQEGLALVGELSLHAPTPVHPPTVPVG